MRNPALPLLVAFSVLLSGCTYSRYTGQTYPLPNLAPEERIDRQWTLRTDWARQQNHSSELIRALATEQIAKQRMYIDPLFVANSTDQGPPLTVEMSTNNYSKDVPKFVVLNGFISAITLFIVPWKFSHKGGHVLTITDGNRVLYRAEEIGKYTTTMWAGPVGIKDKNPAQPMDAYTAHGKIISEQLRAERAVFEQAKAIGTAQAWENFLAKANWYRRPALQQLVQVSKSARDAQLTFDNLLKRYPDAQDLLPPTYLLLARGPENLRIRDLLRRSDRGEADQALAQSVLYSGADYGDFTNEQLKALASRLPQAVLEAMLASTLQTRQYRDQAAAARAAAAQAAREQELAEEREERARQREEEAASRAVIMGAFADVKQTFDQAGADLEANRVRNQAVLNEYNESRAREQEQAAAARADQARRDREERTAQQTYDRNRAAASAQLAAALKDSSAQSQRDAGISAYQQAQAATAAARTSSALLAGGVTVAAPGTGTAAAKAATAPTAKTGTGSSASGNAATSSTAAPATKPKTDSAEYVASPEGVVICELKTGGKFSCTSTLGSTFFGGPNEIEGWRTPAEATAHVGGCRNPRRITWRSGYEVFGCGTGVTGMPNYIDVAAKLGVTVPGRNTYWCKPLEIACARTSKP